MFSDTTNYGKFSSTYLPPIKRRNIVRAAGCPHPAVAKLCLKLRSGDTPQHACNANRALNPWGERF